MTNETMMLRSDAVLPHVRIDEEKVASRKPRNIFLLYGLKSCIMAWACISLISLAKADTKVVTSSAQLSAAFAAADSQGDVVQLLADVTLDERLSLPSGAVLTLDLNGHIVTGTSTDETSAMAVFYVNGSKLTVKDNSAGAAGIVQSRRKLFQVTETGHLTIAGGTYTTKGPYNGGNRVMNAGTVVMTGGLITTALQGEQIYGVRNSGTFCLQGGVIYKCGNSGVYNETGGKFRMDGGVIDLCKSGVYVGSDSTFEMNAGIITNCYTSSGNGGGVFNYYGSFVMNGGQIVDCRTDGGYLGGGVYNLGEFRMTGGLISHCRAYQGGGVYNNKTFVLTGGEVKTCRVERGDGKGTGAGLYNGSKGRTIITGGRIREDIDVFVYDDTLRGVIAISGGLFGAESVSNNSDWLSDGATLEANADSLTCAEYPWVVSTDWTVGVPEPSGVIVEIVDGCLSVSGTGSMADFTSDSPAPWASVIASVTNVVVSSTINRLGAKALDGLSDAATICGVRYSDMKEIRTINGISANTYGNIAKLIGSEAVTPSAVLAPADVTTMHIDAANDCVRMGVTVMMRESLQSGSWTAVDLSKVSVAKEDASVTLTVPASGKSGYFKLVSRNADVVK